MALTFPRDLFMEMFIDGVWNDVMTSVRFGPGSILNVTRGRGGEQGEVAPGSLTCKLDNLSGDFNPSNPMGQWFGKIGRGTPVRYGITVAEDTFTGRTVASGWGTATSGEVWAGVLGEGGTLSATDANVSSGVGNHSVPAASAYRFTTLPVSYRDVEVTATTTVAITNITGGAIEPCNVMVRVTSSTNYYFTRVSIDASEVLTISIHDKTTGQLTTPVTVSGLVDASTSKVITVKMQAEGQTLRAKVYAPGAEPAEWHTQVHTTLNQSAGAIGIRSGVASGNSNSKPIVFANDNIEVRNLRFAGEIVELKPRWSVDHKDKWAELTVGTVLRRIQRGKTPLKSPLRRGYLADDIASPVQYWPCEEGQDAQVISSAIDDNSMHFSSTGRPRFAASTDFIGSAPLPKVNGSQWEGYVTPYAATGETQYRFLLAVPKDGIPDGASVAWFETTGSLRVWEIRYRTGGKLSLDIYNNAGVQVLTGGPVTLELDGALARVSLELTQNGGNVDWDLSRFDVITGQAGGASGSQAGTFGTSSGMRVIIGPRRLTAPVNDVGLGHIVVQSAVTDIFELSSEYGAWRGETPIDRADRLCLENGISTLAYIGSSTPYKMGPQLPSLLPTLLKECQDTAQGTLFESKMTGNTLVLRTVNATYAQDSRLTLDYSAEQVSPPLQPAADDKPIRNDVTAKRLAGGEYRVSQETGPMNAQDPGTDDDAVGRHDQQVPVNVQREIQLPDIANWNLHLGTVKDERWPKVRVNMRAPGITAALQAQILDLDIDDRITLTNLDDADYFDDLDLIVRGYTEIHNTFAEHTIEFNCAPYSPYNVAELDDGESRLADGDSELNASLSSSATSFTVTGELWTTAAGNFPMNVNVGGEEIRLSGISGSGPQTFTVDTGGRSVNGVVKAHDAGTPVEIFAISPLGL